MLYAGLMITNQGPKVLEFNVRFGDPETQVVLVRLKTDLFEVLEAAVDDRLDTVSLEWDPRPAVTVVMASEGYPGPLRARPRDPESRVADRMPDVKVFHAGTDAPRRPGDRPRGPRRQRRRPGAQRHRARGDTLEEAQARAYEAARAIKFPGAWYRRDIGGRPAPPGQMTGDASGAARASSREPDRRERVAAAVPRHHRGSSASRLLGSFFFLAWWLATCWESGRS